jgi:hypothetical protein
MAYTYAWNAVVYCSRLKLNLCLMPCSYTPDPLSLFVCVPDESPFLNTYRTSFPFTSVRKPNCVWFVEDVSWYHFVSPHLQDGSFHHVLNFLCMPIQYGSGLPLSIAAEYKFLPGPRPPSLNEEEGARRTSVAAIGAVFMLPVLRQASLCSLLTFALLILYSTLCHHTMIVRWLWVLSPWVHN